MKNPSFFQHAMHRAHILASFQSGTEIRELTLYRYNKRSEAEMFSVDFCVVDRCEKCKNYALALWGYGYHSFVAGTRVIHV